jgi:hypothetical protein
MTTNEPEETQDPGLVSVGGRVPESVRRRIRVLAAKHGTQMYKMSVEVIMRGLTELEAEQRQVDLEEARALLEENKDE